MSAGAGVMEGRDGGGDGGLGEGIGAAVREGTQEDCGKEGVKHAGRWWSDVWGVVRSHASTSWRHGGPL